MVQFYLTEKIRMHGLAQRPDGSFVLRVQPIRASYLKHSAARTAAASAELAARVCRDLELTTPLNVKEPPRALSLGERIILCEPTGGGTLAYYVVEQTA